MASAPTYPHLKLRYFDFSGRAEVARIMLTLAKIPFDDATFVDDEFSTYKLTAPFKQVPVLEVDGKMLAQSGAINLYVAKLAKMYPEDPLEAAWVDMLVFQCEDILQCLFGGAAGAIADPVEKAKARLEMSVEGGKLYKALDALQSQLPATFCGGTPLHHVPNLADVAIYTICAMVSGGFADGVPKTILTAFPGLSAHFERMASYPPIKAMYTDKPKRENFRTLPVA